MKLTFKGTQPSYATVMSVMPPIKAPVNWGTFNVPGLAGVILTDKNVEPIVIPVKFLVEGKDREEYERNKEDFADWLDSDKPEPLVFSHNPDRTYYAVTQGATLPDDELVIYCEVTVEFFCPKPYKYGPEKSAPFVNGMANIYNKGTLEVKPTIYAEVTADLAHLDVIREDKFMRIGKPLEEGQTPLAAETLLLNNPLSNMTGWAYGGLSVDGGSALGTFTAENGYIRPVDFGTATTHHGPAVKQAVPSAPLTDWKVELDLKFLNPIGFGGRAELYLLDDVGQHIGKLALWSQQSDPNMRCEMRIGGGATYKFLLKDQIGTGIGWNNFEGILRMEKKGNVFKYYIARVDPKTKKHSYAKAGTFTDGELLYIRNLSQVQLHAGIYNLQKPGTIQFRDLKVWRLNTVPKGDPRIIAKVGDIIELNFADSAIFINGEERKDLKDLFATFFKVPRGNSVLALYPHEKVTAIATIREGFK